MYKFDLIKYSFEVRKGSILLDIIDEYKNKNIKSMGNNIYTSNNGFDTIYDLLLKNLI